MVHLRPSYLPILLSLSYYPLLLWLYLPWQVFQSPSFWTVLVLTVLPLYGISVYTYALLFVLIERTDEFQVRVRVRVTLT